MPRRRGSLIWACALVLIGCGGSAQKPASEPTTAATSPAGSLERPVQRCGPRDSYAYVANVYRCPDGKNPFSGDLRAAARARSGSQRSPNSEHLIDTYEVPCAGGNVTVYVDMYGCDEYRKLLVEKSPELDQIQSRFDAGRYGELIGQCEAILERGKPVDAFSWCGVLEPAALVLLGDRRAVAIMARTCEPMPPDSEKSDARVNVVGLAMIALARGSQHAGPEIDTETASNVLTLFAEACRVDPRKVVQRLDAENA